jgi:peptide deformylase
MNYLISDFFASAIINNDLTGLNDAEVNQLNNFLLNLPNEYFYKTKKYKSLDLTNYDEEGQFSKCEITGLKANCLNFKLTYI